ncbi:hypothetical protein [Maricaulis maris]|jgi:hypothetical protein|uniref:hypothetical protein n=1 Tax=Maricaulis maris TaxID=74318 RepID=UPI0005A23091|nr:hypothetical protein [Maricaulis maris]
MLHNNDTGGNFFFKLSLLHRNTTHRPQVHIGAHASCLAVSGPIAGRQALVMLTQVTGVISQ